MPGIPPFTIAAAAHTCKPVDTLVLRTNGRLSILDTIFVSKRSRRAVYATTTHGPHTSLWRVAANGTMTEIARIDWEYEVRMSAGDGSLRNYIQPTKRCSMLTFGGRLVRTEEFLQKGKGWFSSDSRTFSVNDTEYKWKSGTENTGLNDGQTAGQRNTIYHDAVKIWRCVLAHRDSSNSSPKTAARVSASAPYFSGSPTVGAVDSTRLDTVPADLHRVTPASSLAPSIPLLNSSTPVTHDHDQEVQLPSSGIHTVISPIFSAPARPTLLARFTPPQPGLVRNEISLFSPALDFSSDVGQSPPLLECLLVTAVILAATKGEWKQVQSSIDASSLQEIFAAEAAGDVPPYTPGARRITTLGPPVTTQNRNYSGISRRSDYLVREESQLVTNHLVEDSDRVSLLPRRSMHQTSRSDPFSFFPISPSEIQTSTSRTNGVYPSDPGRGAQRSVVSRRPITANSTPGGDDVLTRRRPSLQVVNATRSLTWARQRPSTASGMPSRPISSLPPMYKRTHGTQSRNDVT